MSLRQTFERFAELASDLAAEGGDPVEIETLATEAGIPPDEFVRMLLGFCVGRLVSLGASPGALAGYVGACAQMLDVVMHGPALVADAPEPPK